MARLCMALPPMAMKWTCLADMGVEALEQSVSHGSNVRAAVPILQVSTTHCQPIHGIAAFATDPIPELHTMNLHPIDTGFFKLDGGAMFGVVPKTLWEKHHAPDAEQPMHLGHALPAGGGR